MKIANPLLASAVLLSFLVSGGLAQEQKAAQEPLLKEEYAPPESWADRTRREAAVLELSLNDVIRLALTNNLNIAIENYEEDLMRERIIKTKAFYDPTLSFSLGRDSTEFPTVSILDAGRGIPVNTTTNFTLSPSIRQNLPGGGGLTVGFNNSRFASNNLFRFMNPSFGSGLSISLSQPLWRGFLKTDTRKQLEIHNLDSQINDTQFERMISEIVQQVQIQYWDLVSAIENYEVKRQSMELAMLQHELNKKRLKIGILAPLGVTESQTEVARREQEMIQSEVEIINNQNELKDLLAPGPGASIWNLTLIPLDRPQAQELKITLEEAIDTALERRPELERYRLDRQKVDVERSYLENQGKPSVSLTAGVTSTGRAGQIFQDLFADTDGDGVPDIRAGNVLDPSNPFFGNFGNAWTQVLGFDFVNYHLALNVTIPLRNRSNSADLASLAIDEQRQLSRLTQQQQSIIKEVRTVFQNIVIQKKRLQVARVARELSKKQLEGENRRFQAGLTTNFNLLRYQRDLAGAQVEELHAMIAYQKAVASLDKAMHTIIDANDIVLARRKNG